MNFQIMVERYGLYFGVLSAALIFGSWLISTALAERHKSIERAMTQLASERWTEEALISIVNEQRNQSKSLLAINRHVSPPLPAGWDFSDDSEEFYFMTEKLGFAQELSSDITNLVKSAWRTQDLSKRVFIGSGLKEKLEGSVSKAEELNSKLWAARKEYEKKQKELFGQSVSATEINSNKLSMIYPSYEKYIRTVENVSKNYLSVSNQINQVNAQLYSNARNEAKSSGLIASISSYIAYVLYLFGAALAIYGKYLESKQKSIRE